MQPVTFITTAVQFTSQQRGMRAIPVLVVEDFFPDEGINSNLDEGPTGLEPPAEIMHRPNYASRLSFDMQRGFK